VTDFTPSSTVRGGVLTVTLSGNRVERRTDFDGVVDQTDFGDVLGLEILDLLRQLGGVATPASPTSGFPCWSYDDEIDAFYVHVQDGASQSQKAVMGQASLDSLGSLVALEVAVSPK
jgi:hypothetical protein